MTRMLVAVLSALALSAGALQVRAQAKPTEDGANVCRDGNGPQCKVVSTTTCDRWEFVSVGGSGSSSPSGSAKVECTKKTTTTSTYYYDY